MTRKHFKALADALQAEKPVEHGDHDRYVHRLVKWESCCKAIANVCQQFNAEFNREKFLTACGLTSNET